LAPDAQPQIVGHTRHDAPRQKGDVYCQNVIRNNRGAAGGEAVFVETPNSLQVLRRTPDAGVEVLDW
jgi:hypothetical protein